MDPRTRFGVARAIASAACRLAWPLVFVAVAAMWLAGPARSQTFESKAPHALLIDVETGTVLYEKGADVRMAPASMAKLMTLSVVFDSIADGRLSLDDTLLVSEHAWRTGGAPSRTSTMFLELGSQVSVENLIRGAIIQSGNDACIVLAEGIAGTEASFADLMNQAGRRLDLQDSHFVNATGLPDPDEYVTAWDLAKIALHIIRDYPQYYPIFAEESFTWNGIDQSNRNKLLSMSLGVDGMKTGHTEESGYGIVVSAVQNGQRLVGVLNGMADENERKEEATRLLNWGFRSFRHVTLFPSRQVIGEARVFGGEKPTVEVVSRSGIELLLPVGRDDLLEARVRYDGPIPAPVERNQDVGTLQIEMDGRVLKEAPVIAGEAVANGEFRSRALDGLMELLFSWF